MEDINLIPVDFIEKYIDQDEQLIRKIINDWRNEYSYKTQLKTTQEQALEVLKRWLEN